MDIDARPSIEKVHVNVFRSLDVLPGPRGLPLIGNALQIQPAQFHRQLERWSETYGERYTISLGPTRYLVCSNSEDVSRVLKDRPTGFRRTGRTELVARELGIDGLFSSNGDSWRRQRPLVMSAFSPKHVKSYFPSLRLVTERLRKRWEKNAGAADSLDLEAELMRYTVDVTTGLAFGQDINTLEADGAIIQQHLEDIFRMLQKRLFAVFPYWHWIRFAEDRKLEKDVKVVAGLVQGFIQAARKRMEQDPALFEQPSNLLEAMIAARDDDNAALSEAELAGNVVTMLLAGEDTTANTLAWLIHLLYHHPAVLNRAREEVDRVLGQDVVPMQHGLLGRLEYVEACINEAMRLRPVAPLIIVESNQETSVADVCVPKNTVVMLLTRVGAMDDQNFANAQDFNPERWIGPATDANRRKASTPFGAGPRVCPGRYLAMEEMKMVASMLIRNFEIADVCTPDGQEVQERLTFTMAPAGLRMSLRRRQ